MQMAMTAPQRSFPAPPAEAPADRGLPDYELYLSLDLPDDAAALRSVKVALIPWANAGWERFTERTQWCRDEGRVLRAIPRVIVERRREPGAEGFKLDVMAVSWWMAADRAMPIGEARARQQFWQALEHGLFDYRAAEAAVKR